MLQEPVATGIGWRKMDQLIGIFVIRPRGDQDLRPTVGGANIPEIGTGETTRKK